MSNLATQSRKDSIQAFRDEIDDTFNRWLPMRIGNGMSMLDNVWPNFNGTTPALEVTDEENEITVRAELPGVEKDDFKIEINGDRLTIRGEKKTTKEEKKKDYLYTECSYGSFERSVSLPCPVNAEKADAQLKSGVLTLRLPKMEVCKPKQVQVKAS